MKLQQLRYLIAVVDNGMNITAASEALFTSQPGISKQLRLLEDELQLTLFQRKGKSLTRLTEAGQKVTERARNILREVDNIRKLSQTLAGQVSGELALATTHTQARYVLPGLFESFQKKHRKVSLRLHEGTSEQIAEAVQQQEVDFAIASGESRLFNDLVTFPIYRWERIILLPPDHPLTGKKALDLKDLAQYPLVSYTYSFNEDSSLTQSFADAGIEPNVVFTSHDPDVIKTVVRKGMGIGIVACMAYDAALDSDLTARSAAQLFPTCTTWIGFRKDRFLSDYMVDFLAQLVPGLSRREINDLIQQAHEGKPLSLPAEHEYAPLHQHPALGGGFSECCG